MEKNINGKKLKTEPSMAQVNLRRNSFFKKYTLKYKINSIH